MNEAQLFETWQKPVTHLDLGQDKAIEPIRFAFSPSSLGTMLIAATEKGLCALSLGEDRDEMFCDLRRKFPGARLLSGEGPDFVQLASQVTGFVDGSLEEIAIPLDIRGSEFQKRVWRALREIPFGTTASYANVAAKIGQPKSVRAVAGACAANKIAILIPCHRVLRSDGGLSGFRWGIELKRKLLDREARS